MPSYEKRSDKWSVRFRHSGQNKRLSGYRTKAEATKAYADYISRTPVYNRATDAYEIEKFDDLLVMYLDRQRGRVRDSTFNNQASTFNNILSFFSGKRIRDITKSDCEEWISTLHYKPSTLKHKRTVLNSVFAFMERECNIPNPLRRADIKIRDDGSVEKSIITVEQYGKFRLCFDGAARTIIDLLFFSGARFGEILALTRDDVKPYYININKQKKDDGTITATKTKFSVRKVSIPKWLYDEALEHIDEIGHISRSYIYRRFAKAKEKFGFDDGFTVHSLRHSHASMLLSAGVPVTAVSRRLGHSNPSITMEVYAHMIPDDESIVMNVLEKVGTNLGTEFEKNI